MARLWHTETGQLKQTLRGTTSGAYRSLAFSPDSETLFLASDLMDSKRPDDYTMDSVISSWNLKIAKVKWSTRESLGTPPLVKVSSDGKTLATQGENTIHLRNAQTGKLLNRLSAPDNAPTYAYTIAFSPNGKTMATDYLRDNENRGVTAVWDMQRLVLLRSLEHHSEPVTSIAYSPDGKMLATGSDDHTVNVWDTQTWNIITSVGKQRTRPVSLSQSPLHAASDASA